MNRIDVKFQQLRSANRKALIPFITAGDPSLEATVPVMHALVRAGADLIELGVPFSDPMADGPTIQRSSERALARGAGMAFVLETVRSFRARDPATPVVLMGYLNPVEVRGVDAFAHEAAAAGVDGVLLIDLPPEEMDEYRASCEAAGIALILLAAPTTSDARMKQLYSAARGYLYYVSFAGVTGASDQLDTTVVGARLNAIRQRSPVPVVAGFGIRDAADAAAIAAEAAGVVVGSALVGGLAGAVDTSDAAARTVTLLAPLRAALDGVR